MICYYFIIDMSNQFLAPGGLNAECVKVVSYKPGASRELDLRPPRPEMLQMF